MQLALLWKCPRAFLGIIAICSTAQAQTAPRQSGSDVAAARIPAVIWDKAATLYDCNAGIMKEAVTSYDVSKDKAVWEITCDRFAYQASTVFAFVNTKDPAIAPGFLMFNAPKGKARATENGILMNANYDPKKRQVTGVAFGRGLRDCGTYERHRVLANGKTKLLEYREQPTCDERSLRKMQDLDKWPLVFRAK